ncbi:hypothetical protein [Deinococcus frigens]|uniref:hypothetical protein n=1 Tax=Deinococcus frigens TaxID=249403 RepID=UPI000495959F|nr:hypothetical protein [Deinococcus frigens]
MSALSSKTVGAGGQLYAPYLPLVWMAASLGLWRLSLPLVELNRIDELGLVSALPPLFYVAPSLLTLSFWHVIRQRSPHKWTVLLHVIALIFMLHATLPILYDVPRFAWVYKHIGVVDYIIRNGAVDASIDAYHNWPGFFAVAALLVRVSGSHDAQEIARWAPLAFNLLYVGPLLLIFRAFTRQAHVVWLAVWLFFLGNWVSQDYFAPQAFAYLFFLFVIAACLTWIQPHAVPPLKISEQEQGWTVYRLVYGTVILAAVVIAASHQLTPFMLMAALIALMVAGSRRLWPVLAVVVISTLLWDIFMARPYLAAYSHWYSSLGSVGLNLKHNVSSTNQYSADHLLIVTITRVMSLLLWGVAFLGGLRGLWQKQLDWRAVLLALTPFPMLVLGSYGGEMLLRIYLFSLPFMAYLAATAVFSPGASRPGHRSAAAALALQAVLLCGYFFAQFGNELTNRVGAYDVRAAQYLYAHARPQSVIATVTINNFPLKLEGNYAEFDHQFLVDDQLDRNRVLTGKDYRRVLQYGRDTGAPAVYFVISNDQKVYGKKFRLLAPGAFDSVAQSIREDPDARVFYRKEQTVIYEIPLSEGRQ